MSVIGSKALVAVGVGRKDYSQNVEFAVEPMIRSHQSDYSIYEEIAVAAGATVTMEIDIEEETVVIVYDFYLSVPANIMIEVHYEFFSAIGTWISFARQSGYQTIPLNFARGWPLFDKYRITITNHDALDVTCHFSAHGVVTSESEYYGKLTVP